MIFILGGDGFVGSGYKKFFDEKQVNYRVINKSNYIKFKGKKCDILINCSTNSKKFLAEKNFKLDFDLTVNHTLNSITDFKYDKYVLISSGEVYYKKSKSATYENNQIKIDKISNYGFNKYLSEILVQKYCDKYIIFRMGGFVGEGIKKNIVYDLLNNKKLRLKAKSKLQFINTYESAKISYEIFINNKYYSSIYNLTGKGSVTVSLLKKLISSKSSYHKESTLTNYDMNLEKIQKIKSIPTTASSVKKFIENKKK